ncbi:MAG: SIMPL domain-containing protein [Nocardioidaceae bacterium]
MKTITVSLRTLSIGVAVAIALVLAFVVGQRANADPASGVGRSAAGDTSTTPTRTIIMSGHGSITTVPNELTFVVTVSNTSADVTTALSGANAGTRQVLQALEAKGIAGRDLKTTGLSIQPQYNYSGGSAVLVGYNATERLNVVVEKLSEGGKAISAAAGAGGNSLRISNVQLRVKNADAVLAQARKAAVQEALSKADQYVAAAGASLGEVTAIREVNVQPVIPEMMAMRAANSAVSKVPIRAGTQQVGVTVQVTWTIGP